MPWEIFWTGLLQIFIAIIVLIYPAKLLIAHIARSVTGATLRVFVEAGRILARDIKETKK